MGRVLSAVIAVLCLPLLASAQTEPPKQDVYEPEIAKFEADDLKNPPVKGGIVFVGSSSIRMWKSLKEDFPAYPTLNRGFGGSQIADSVKYAKRIVTPYKPKIIVFFAGTNDLASGKKADTVLADYKRFVTEVRSELPATPIVYIAITPAPSRWSNVEEIKKANGLIKEYAKSQPNLRFLDTFPLLLDDKGQPRPELFVSDQLHMNPKGYEIWTKALAPLLDELWKTQQTFSKDRFRLF